jgi:hypothetical protein
MRERARVCVECVQRVFVCCGVVRLVVVTVILFYFCFVASCTFDVTVNDNEAPSLICPADYTVPADDANQGATVDLTADLTDVVSSDNCGINANAIAISDPSSADAAILPPGSNVITVSAVDVNGNAASCTYVVEVLPIGACCGGASGCVDGVVDCQNGGTWVADTTCANDCGKCQRF